MGRTQRMKDGVQVSLRLPQGEVELLRRLARRRAIETDCDVLYSDLLREIVHAALEPELKGEDRMEGPR